MRYRKKQASHELESVTIALPNNEEIGFDQSIAIGNGSIIGTRESQQDSAGVFLDPDRELAIGVVCDGMGGMESGELASNLGVQRFCEGLAELDSEEGLPEKMIKLVNSIDEEVFDLIDEKGQYIASGTTLVGVVILKNKAYWISVGDSRIFLFRDGKLEALNVEHNYRYLVDIKKEDTSFQSSSQIRDDALISYMGKGGLEYIDYNQFPCELKCEDCFLLVSDGITKTLSEDMLQEILCLNQYSVERMKERILESVSNSGKTYQDNATVVILKYYGNKEEEHNDEISEM